MSLVKAETERFLARRFIRAMTVLILVIFGIVAVSIGVNTQPITAERLAWAERQSQIQVERDKQAIEQQYQNCLISVAANDGAYPPDFNCADWLQKMPTMTAYPEQFLPTQFEFDDEIVESLMLATAILCLFGFVVAASFVGAEWTSGGMVNLLLWRPRRLSVLTTKLGTALGGVLTVSVVYLGLWTGVLWLIAVTRGDPGGMDAAAWGDVAQLCVRALALVVAVAAVGFALATLGRHTAAALGIGVGYALVAELGALLLLDLTGSYFPERFRLSTYLTAWMVGEVRLYDFATVCVPAPVGSGPGTECRPQEFLIDLPTAGTVLGLVALGLVGLSYLAMHRRDAA